MSKEKVPTVHQALQFAWMKDGKVDRSMIEEFLLRDLKGIHVLLTEMLSDPEIIDAITNVIAKRYQKVFDANKAEPEIPFNNVPK